ncbi:helix-turn-helix domain-containing protein [Streptosporangium sp. NPDC023963]|uniref:helix-turn-helix domain-containing protein n=1 Tax=Streptosporangium sp. NPDC023963 TaxID=3155608 RepID=UPI0034166AE9
MERLGYRVKECADSLGIGERTMWDLVNSGEVESVKVQGCRIIPADALVQYMGRLRAEQATGGRAA